MDWQAKWIWAESLREAANCYVYARREFDVISAPSAEVLVTCSSAYKLYANGRFIGRGPGPCRPDSQYYDTYDLNHALRPGKNVVAAICYNQGVATSSDPQMPGGFLLQLTIHRNGEEERVIPTDEQWRVLSAPDWDFGSDLGFQEVYDSREKPVGWNVVGFDDSAWETAFVIGEVGCEPWPNLEQRQIRPLKEWDVFPQQMLACGTVSPAAVDDLSVLKYAREMLRPSGDVAIVSAGRDCFLVLDFGMELVGYPCLRIRAAGSATIDIAYGEALDEHGCVDATRQGIVQADRIILHGGRQEWQAMGRRAFRYVQLTLRNIDTPISIESFQVARVGYPVQLASSFECSDELLNEIWRTGVYTLSVCMQDVYESSPLSDRSQSALDARLQALTNYYCFFDSALAAKALDDLARRLVPDPAWVTMLHDYYLHTADQALVAQLYPRVKALIGDASEIDDYEAVRDAEKLARAVSVSEDALIWHARADQLRHAVGSAVECSDPRTAFRALQDLAAQGRAQKALDLIRLHWGAMLRLGATTWWESFPVDDAIPSGSLCRGSSSAPTYFLTAEILGVKPSTPGGGAVIQPRAGDLAWAKGKVKTIKGMVEVEWRRDADRFTLDIEAPEGFLTAVPLEGFTNPIVDEIDLTPETPDRRARRTYGWGTTIWRDGEERDPYLDWLATQDTQPPNNYARRERCSVGESYLWVRECVSTHVRYEVSEG